LDLAWLGFFMLLCSGLMTWWRWVAVGGGTDGTVPVTEAAPGTIVSALMAPARGLIVCLFSQALFFYFSVILFPLIRFLQNAKRGRSQET